MALIGSTLHFGYSDMLDMYINDFMEFINISNEIVKTKKEF
jgi:hypothetical protein